MKKKTKLPWRIKKIKKYNKRVCKTKNDKTKKNVISLKKYFEKKHKISPTIIA